LWFFKIFWISFASTIIRNEIFIIISIFVLIDLAIVCGSEVVPLALGLVPTSFSDSPVTLWTTRNQQNPWFSHFLNIFRVLQLELIIREISKYPGVRMIYAAKPCLRECSLEGKLTHGHFSMRPHAFRAWKHDSWSVFGFDRDFGKLLPSCALAWS